ncbi:MAG: hypothetical protein QXW17_01135 [Candidatus Bathyarchaeia archaeon]
MSQEKNRLKQIVLEGVDEGLLQTLGNSGKEAIYFHLQRMYSLTKEDIPNNLSVFASGLEKIFGIGAKVIEGAIIESICRKLQIKYEEKKNMRLIDCLQSIIENPQVTE